MATKQTEKQLTLAHAKRQIKKYNEQEKYTLHDDTLLTFYPYFSNDKIDKLLDELQMFIKESEEQELKLTDKLLYGLINLLIIKHFTHLKKYIKGNLLDHIEALNILNNAGYLHEIMNDVFIVHEVEKVYSRLSDILAQNQVLENILFKANERARELELKNKELFEQIDKIDGEKQIQ